MFNSTKRMGAAALLGLAALVFCVPDVHGQNPFFQIRPGLTISQHAFNLARIGQGLSFFPPYAFGFNRFGGFPGSGVNPFLQSSLIGGYGGYAGGIGASPYGSYGGDPYSYSYYDPYGGYLRGYASVITSQGQFLLNQQQGFLMKEQIKAEQISNRRRTFDEYLYEREKTPTAEEERERHDLEQLNRSRNNPPVNDVWSGKALNDLLADLRKLQNNTDSASLRNFQVPLDEDGLKHINVTTAANAGNIGLLKNDGRLNWPVALSSPDYRVERERLSSLAQKAVQQAEFNSQVDPGLIEQMSKDVDALHKQLRANGSDLPPSAYIEAKTFLNSLDDAIKALKQRDVANYFNGKYALKAKTISDLVKAMDGLQFAPAVPGDESAYLALHQALAVYDRAAQPQTAAR